MSSIHFVVIGDINFSLYAYKELSSSHIGYILTFLICLQSSQSLYDRTHPTNSFPPESLQCYRVL